MYAARLYVPCAAVTDAFPMMKGAVQYIMLKSTQDPRWRGPPASETQSTQGEPKESLSYLSSSWSVSVPVCLAVLHLTVCPSETWDVSVVLKPQPPCSSCGFVHVLKGTGATDEMLTQCECVRGRFVCVLLQSVLCGLQSV